MSALISCYATIGSIGCKLLPKLVALIRIGKVSTATLCSKITKTFVIVVLVFMKALFEKYHGM